MNLTKSFLGVTNGKFLGFVVTSKGIHLDSEKVRAIQEMYLQGILESLEDYKDD